MATLISDRVRGFAGLKADSREDTVETFPCSATPVPFGVVCGTDASGNLVPGPGTKARGISVHSHSVSTTTYEQYDAVSVMTRGMMWAAVTAAGAVTENGVCKYAADGTVSDAGVNTLTNAVFRSGVINGPGTTKIALVELHSPMVA